MTPDIVPFASFKVPGTVTEYTVSWRKVPDDLACENPGCQHRKGQHSTFGAKGLHKCEVKGCACKDFIIDKSKLAPAGEAPKSRSLSMPEADSPSRNMADKIHSMDFETDVKKFGNGAHILVDKRFLGHKVRVHIELVEEEKKQ